MEACEKKEDTREKIGRLGIRALSDKELLMLLIQNGSRTRSLEEISSDVLALLDRKSSIMFSELSAINGLSNAKASIIAASLELGRRRIAKQSVQIKSPEDVYNSIRHYSDRSQEHLIVVALNGAHEIIYTETVTVGLVNMTIVHPREVFSNAIEKRASAIIIAHNHPSGRLNPSSEDIDMTRKIVKAGSILGISVLDHLIISSAGYLSFKAKGLI